LSQNISLINEIPI